MCFGTQKNYLFEMVVLSTHNICFVLEIRKINLNYAILSRGLINDFSMLELSGKCMYTCI